MKIAKKGDNVKVEYVGTLEDGTVFDSSENHEAPLEFTVGNGQIIKGFDEALIGMKIGDEKEVKLAPKDAYGDYNPELVRDIPKEIFPENQEVKVGMVFMMNLPDGRQVPVKISDVSNGTVTVDLNPLLAGKTLIFKIKLLEIKDT